jgi:hypothetical protein
MNREILEGKTKKCELGKQKMVNPCDPGHS